MKKYQVTGKVITVSPGSVVQLSKDQADARAFCLESAGKNRYQVTKPIYFKRGEILGVDGELPKTLVAEMEDQSAQRDADEAKRKEAEEAARKEAEEAARKEAEEAERKAAEEQAAAAANNQTCNTGD